MANDSTKPDGQEDPQGAPPGVIAEAQVLIDDFLDGEITPQRQYRLEQLVVDHPAVSRLYAVCVELAYTLPAVFERHDAARKAATTELNDLYAGQELAQGSGALDEAMIMPAIHSDPEAARIEDAAAPDKLVIPAPASTHWALRKSSRLAAVLLLALGVAWMVWPSHPVITTATAGAVFDGPANLVAGTTVSRNQPVHLREGALELKFSSGAVAVVSGPAVFEVTDQNTMQLDSGSVCAHIPPKAVGFSVTAPGLCVVDLGTDFGVRITNAGTCSEVDVFTGSVNATALDSAGNAMGSPLRLTAGQAVGHDSGSTEPACVPASYNPAIFVRSLSDVRLPLKLHGTGVEATADSMDLHWELLSVPKDPTWKPRPASVAVSIWGTYPPNTSAARWIGPTPVPVNAPVGDFVFRANVDLTGFDPTTTSIVAREMADDMIEDIRVNGASTGISIREKQLNILTEHVITLPDSLPWKSGLNQVDVVVRNLPCNAPVPNMVALKWSWTGTASPLIQRK